MPDRMFIRASIGFREKVGVQARRLEPKYSDSFMFWTCPSCCVNSYSFWMVCFTCSVPPRHGFGSETIILNANYCGVFLLV